MINSSNSKIQGTEYNNDISRKTSTVKELQETLGLGYQKTMELVHRDDFPKIIVGKRILIVNSKLDQWIENNIGLSL